MAHSLKHEVHVLLHCLAVQSTVHEALVSQFHYVVRLDLQSAALGGNTDSGLAVEWLLIEEKFLTESQTQIASVVIFLDKVVISIVPKCQLAMHHEVEVLDLGVLLEQLLALLDLHNLAQIKDHFECIE